MRAFYRRTFALNDLDFLFSCIFLDALLVNPLFLSRMPVEFCRYESHVLYAQAYGCSPDVFANDQQDTSRNQVFPSESFGGLVTALQVMAKAYRFIPRIL